jgi:xylan 1,4-beta-xylosidase
MSLQPCWVCAARLCPILILISMVLTVSAALRAQQSSALHRGWIEFHSFQYRGEDAFSAALSTARQYSNPILAGFYPDPSVLRVGEDYYLVNSSFAWYPGVPIFHSRDLVNWTQIGSVLTRPDQLQLDGARVSEGVFAPTLRFHEGRFYMITTNISGIGNFYVTATNPAGPWSEPIKLPEINGIDPSFFFDDDGRAYIVHNGPPPGDKPLYSGHRAIWLFPFDEKAGKVSGPGRIIVNGGTDLSKQPIWIEGPHLLEHGGFYYLIAAEGGTGEQHSEVVFRSQAVAGPYEPYKRNPILTQRSLPDSRPRPITSTGHADFVETQNGEWWAVFLGCEPYQDGFYNTGRETFLMPVKWVDGWPVILQQDQAVPRVGKMPTLPSSSPPVIPTHGSFDWADDFDEQELPYVFNLLRTPGTRWWDLAERPGSLLIQPRTEDLDSKHNPSLIAHRQQHANFSASVELQFSAQDMPSDAGLVAFQNETHSYFLGVRVDQRQHRNLFLEKRNDSVSQVTSVEIPQGADRITLKIEGKGVRYRFYDQLPGGAWQPVGGDQDGAILSTKVAGGFVGTYIGMFARLLH